MPTTRLPPPAPPPMATTHRPNRWLSAAIGFAVAPAVATPPVPAIMDHSLDSYLDSGVWMLALLLTYAHAAFIGVPVYLLSRNRISYRPMSLALTGAVVAIAPSIVLLPWYASVIPFYAQIAVCGALRRNRILVAYPALPPDQLDTPHLAESSVRVDHLITLC